MEGPRVVAALECSESLTAVGLGCESRSFENSLFSVSTICVKEFFHPSNRRSPDIRFGLDGISDQCNFDAPLLLVLMGKVFTLNFFGYVHSP